MFDLEQRVHDQLPTNKRRRFRWLVQNRTYLAQVVAECHCWGLWDLPALEHQLVLTERAIYDLIADCKLAEAMSTHYAERDAALMHPKGRPPEGLDCVVCRTGGYTINDVLDRLPQPIG